MVAVTPAARRSIGAIIGSAGVAAAASALLACGPREQLSPAVDLVAGLAHAERRPGTASFTVAEVTVAGVTMRAIETAPVSRATWEISIPSRAVLKTALALKPGTVSGEGGGILFRIGITEGRTYEELLARQVDPLQRDEDRQWVPVAIDLSRYGGLKWSIFYQPGRLKWRIIFNTNVGAPLPEQAAAVVPVWGEPMIHAPRP